MHGENFTEFIDEGRTTTRTEGSRRSFLKLAGGVALAGAGLAVLPLSQARAKALLADIVDKNKFPVSGIYTSDIYNIGSTFGAVGAYWEVGAGDATTLHVSLRVSSDNINFTNWLDASFDGDGRTIPAANGRFYGRVVLATGLYVQYRVDIPVGVQLNLVGLSAIDNSAPPGLASGLPKPGSAEPEGLQPRIISRVEWGANEGLRFEKGTEVWPREYVSAKVMIVHHSETTNTYNADPAVDVRSIYYYHAITKGWGDIGYNFLVDWKGNIYEGRFGGADAVGGHAYQYNYGSVGVCLIGSFAGTRPTDAQLNSLHRLLAWKAQVKSIDPNARIYFVDRANVATISGHRDVINTSCPGQVEYDLLPTARSEVTRLLNSTPDTGTFGVQLVSLQLSPTTILGNQVLKVSATIKNTGTKLIETQDPAPGYTYEEGQNYLGQGFPKVSNKFRLTLDFGSSDGNPYPYRWGFGQNLNPGELVTITGYVRLKTKQVVNFYGGVIQEYVKYHVESFGLQQVSVLAAGYPTQRAASKAADKNVWYFNETGHNLGYSFRTFWIGNGGLPVFGFPLTEEFQEVSPTDGKVYTVQYFERNRFEYHPENKNTPFEVQLGLLGVQLTQGRDFPKSAPFTSTPDRWYFPQTQHSLGGSFLKYWLNNGGLALFGYPTSEELQEQNPDDGKSYTVQYFERNRFEYHPEFKNTRFEVLLGLLGKDVLRRRDWLQPGL